MAAGLQMNTRAGVLAEKGSECVANISPGEKEKLFAFWHAAILMVDIYLHIACLRLKTQKMNGALEFLQDHA